MAKKQGISARAVGRALGVTHPAVLAAAADGRIPRYSDGSFDLEAVSRAWLENTDITKPRNLITGNPKGDPAGTAAPDTLRGIARSNAIRAYYAALREKAAYEEVQGTLIKREDVERVAFTMYRTVRDRLLALPDRVGPMVAGTNDVPLAIKAIRDEVMLVLNELGDGTFDA